ncbi:uncharacterized protein LOC119688666 [Teleopsis dalmanni]|uniref:uncharacterized protein LOC119688666 n=1 Tax=Teleopsis dalmanni TaxID=139649 RepID=UPI0018CEE026|nr:uncharacterized protein LOC119688666 [Teleopsis dalmanni]
MSLVNKIISTLRFLCVCLYEVGLFLLLPILRCYCYVKVLEFWKVYEPAATCITEKVLLVFSYFLSMMVCRSVSFLWIHHIRRVDFGKNIVKEFFILKSAFCKNALNNQQVQKENASSDQLNNTAENTTQMASEHKSSDESKCTTQDQGSKRGCDSTSNTSKHSSDAKGVSIRTDSESSSDFGLYSLMFPIEKVSDNDSSDYNLCDSRHANLNAESSCFADVLYPSSDDQFQLTNFNNFALADENEVVDYVNIPRVDDFLLALFSREKFYNDRWSRIKLEQYFHLLLQPADINLVCFSTVSDDNSDMGAEKEPDFFGYRGNAYLIIAPEISGNVPYKHYFDVLGISRQSLLDPQTRTSSYTNYGHSLDASEKTDHNDLKVESSFEYFGDPPEQVFQSFKRRGSTNFVPKYVKASDRYHVNRDYNSDSAYGGGFTHFSGASGLNKFSIAQEHDFDISGRLSANSLYFRGEASENSQHNYNQSLRYYSSFPNLVTGIESGDDNPADNNNYANSTDVRSLYDNSQDFNEPTHLTDDNDESQDGII